MSYEAESTALFAAMTSAPDDTRKGHIDTLIAGLKSDGVWSLMDRLFVCAAHHEQAARLDWITAGNAMTAVNSPTFTTDRGFTGDGATSYLDSSWNPTTAGSPKMTQNDGHQGVWCGTDVSAFNQYDVGHQTRAMICARNASNALIYPNSGTSANGALSPATSVGHAQYTRRSSTAFELYKNGASISETTSTSGAFHNASFLVGAANSSGAAATGFSTRRIQAVHWGSQLTDAQATAIYDRLATYMTAVGA